MRLTNRSSNLTIISLYKYLPKQSFRGLKSQDFLHDSFEKYSIRPENSCC